jgi:hypothetical protein
MPRRFPVGLFLIGLAACSGGAKKDTGSVGRRVSSAAPVAHKSSPAPVHNNPVHNRKKTPARADTSAKQRNPLTNE